MMFVVVIAALVAPTAFYIIAAALTAFSIAWSSNLSISCVFGAYRMRRDCGKDWHSQLQQMQKQSPDGENEVMHIVILPNYQETEQMMLHTLENLGRAPLARSSIHVVLAMEEREASGRDKAERLISRSSHLFAGILATFHPHGLMGEIAGKSANCQWAYRHAMQQLAPEIARFGASRVFLTVGDADTLWHPQFFSALACQALEMPEHERKWTIWQPPVLLLRNLFSVPGPTRVSAYGTILFELAGLANQIFSSHFCYSAYSLSLALAANPMVSGWDSDVIAEDHHMFCKCYFAALWEQIEGQSSLADGGPEARALVPKVQLQPVYLPAISYLVESDDGWMASSFARFQQARRHSQGVAELSYVLLQYALLLHSVGASMLPRRTHTGILGIAGKMATVHIINQVQAFAMVVTTAVLVPGVLAWLWAGGLSELMQAVAAQGLLGTLSAQTFGGIRWALVAIFGPLPPWSLLFTATTYIVIRDALEGKLTQGTACSAHDSQLAAPDVQGSAPSAKGLAASALSWYQKLKLLVMIEVDSLNLGELTLLLYGLIPVTMAAWSLLRHGSKFEYVVAAKPK